LLNILRLEEDTMKAIKIEERLGLLGALIVLIGVSSAAGEALAAETADLTTTAIAIHEAAEDTLEIAEQANAEAAAKAAATLAIENGLDLDIRFDDRTSILVAGHE
jgi:5,10-methylene-tetrahydrofolate dehydrogenase/methenyl tetrahydrofolate cyclohydrolase